MKSIEIINKIESAGGLDIRQIRCDAYYAKKSVRQFIVEMILNTYPCTRFIANQVALHYTH
jgi:predicted transposase YbfD/YdcC